MLYRSPDPAMSHAWAFLVRAVEKRSIRKALPKMRAAHKQSLEADKTGDRKLQQASARAFAIKLMRANVEGYRFMYNCEYLLLPTVIGIIDVSGLKELTKEGLKRKVALAVAKAERKTGRFSSTADRKWFKSVAYRAMRRLQEGRREEAK